MQQKSATDPVDTTALDLHVCFLLKLQCPLPSEKPSKITNQDSQKKQSIILFFKECLSSIFSIYWFMRVEQFYLPDNMSFRISVKYQNCPLTLSVY